MSACRPGCPLGRECHLEATRQWRAEHPEHAERYNAGRRRPPLEDLDCAVCGESYAPVRVDQRYCSPACKSKRIRREGR